MAVDSWQAGSSADWSNGADWSGGVPYAGSTASIGGTAAYVVTLVGGGACAALTLNDTAAQFYVSGGLTLTGLFALQAGTFTLAGGDLAGGTLALQGGTFLTNGGVFNGVAVDGPLVLAQPDETLFVQNGLALAGPTGNGPGSLAITGAYASVDFLGSQTLSNAAIALGASANGAAASLQIAHASGATAAATLTLAAGVTLSDTAGNGQIVIGTLAGPGGKLPDTLVNDGLIVANGAGADLAILGSGTLANAGTIAASNGAVLDLAVQGVQNTGVISLNGATLALGGTFSAALFASLGSITLTGSTVSLAGTANLGGGTLALGSGSGITGSLGALSLAGEIENGVLSNAGGGLSYTAATGTLSNVAYQGNLALTGAGAGLTLANGASVGGGSIVIAGSGAALLLEGSETINGVTITLGGAAGAALGTADAFLASTATTATLGAQAVLQQTGRFAALEANGFSPFPGIGLDDTLVNAGSIQAAFSGGTLSVTGYGSFINQGAITVSGGDTLLDTASLFANAGTLTAGTGGTAILGASLGIYGLTPAWSNSGLLATTGGTLVLEGDFTTAALGHVSESGGGLLSLAGTLENQGGTLALGATSGLTNVSLAGTIDGGAIADSTGLLAFASGATCDGVTDEGTLSLGGAGASLDVLDGLTVTGALRVTGAGALLDFTGAQTLTAAQILLGAAGTAATIDVLHDYTASGASLLTLASGDAITQAGTLATLGTAQQLSGDGIVSHAAITAAIAGGTFSLGGQDFTNLGTITVSNGDTLAIAAAAFSNGGAITVSNATLKLSGNLTLAELGQLNLNNAAIGVSGTLALGGGTLSIGTGTAWGTLSLSGTLAGGIIADSGGGLIDSGNADLSGITYLGPLNLSRPFASLSFSNGLTLLPATGPGSGSILLTGAQSRLIATSNETLGNCTITIGSPAQYYGPQALNAPLLAAAAGVQLTFASSTSVTATGLISQLGNLSLGNWTDSIVNNGTVSTAVAGNTLTLDSTAFDNLGTLSATGGGILWVSDATLANAGMFSIGAGAVVQVSLFNYFSAPNAGPTILTNTGSIAMQGGTLHEMTANGLFPGVPFINAAGARIAGTGTVIAPIANSGTIEALGGQLTMAGTLSGTGSLLIGAGATLDLGTTVNAGEIVSFTANTGTLMLNQPSLFNAAIANFVPGDVIDLPGQAMTFLAISNGSVAVNTPVQQILLNGNAPFAGALAGGSDGHGGAMLTYLPRGTGSILAVSEPNMLFWTTPAGQVLTGPSANFRGAETCNWSNYSSLDVTDLNPSLAHLTATGNGSSTTLSATDGTHSFTMTFSANVTPSLFHVASDGHGGSLITT